MPAPNTPRLALVRAGRATARAFGGLWGRWRAPHTRPVLPLDAVRRRLELLLAAMYGREIHISPADRSPRPSWTARLLRRDTRAAGMRTSLSASDGRNIRLPGELDASAGDEHALAEYRLLAIEHAERIVRGTAVLAPARESALERDLYLLSEGAAVDRAIARTVHGALPALERARASALAQRPPLNKLGRSERAVEELVRQVLRADPARPPADVSRSNAPTDSLTWARETAARLRRTAAPYRALPPVALWGTVVGAADHARPGRAPNPYVMEQTGGISVGALPTGRGESGSGRDPDDSGDESTLSPVRDGHPKEPVEDPAGVPTPVRGEGGNPAGATAAIDAPSTPKSTRSDAVYHEWDCAIGGYQERCVVVRQPPPIEADGAWATDVLKEHAVLVRRIRQRFERLRPRRARLGQQREGDELDLAACVRAVVDLRTGHAVDDRLYVAVRPARRGLAIALLVDVSGSTDAPVTATHQVIDVEKTAVLLASEALDALGDSYAVLAFAGQGMNDVRLTRVKDFTEPNGTTVRRRISALRPGGNTRLGAAVRHASALLARQAAGHRLLLILSDGKPNDSDRYQGRYAVEDTRQAIIEARAGSVHPFCLTVDREEPGYLSRIFGPAGYTILLQPDHLPLALLQVVRELLGA